jgi:hypothetical protein
MTNYNTDHGYSSVEEYLNLLRRTYENITIKIALANEEGRHYNESLKVKLGLERWNLLIGNYTDIYTSESVKNLRQKTYTSRLILTENTITNKYQEGRSGEWGCKDYYCYSGSPSISKWFTASEEILNKNISISYITVKVVDNEEVKNCIEKVDPNLLNYVIYSKQELIDLKEKEEQRINDHIQKHSDWYTSRLNNEEALTLRKTSVSTESRNSRIL